MILVAMIDDANVDQNLCVCLAIEKYAKPDIEIEEKKL